METIKANEYLNLNHLFIKLDEIKKIKNELVEFQMTYFKEQLLNREQVLDFLSDDDRKSYKVFGLPIKEFLDLAEKDKCDRHIIGEGKYIIDRKNKTIHVFRYPSADVFTYDNITPFLDERFNTLTFTHIRNYGGYHEHDELCDARRLEAWYNRRDIQEYNNLVRKNVPDIVGTFEKITRQYSYNIKNNTFDNITPWKHWRR